MKIQGIFGHTIGGLFWFDLPLGVLLSFIFHNMIRDRLFDNLPLFLKARFSAFIPFDWNTYFKKNWFVVILSVLIGAISHILWDGFTHEHGCFVEVMPVLKTAIYLCGAHVPVFSILQHSSTAIGGLIIAFVVYKLPVNHTETKSGNATYWVVVVGMTLGIIAARLLGGLDVRRFGDVIVTGISAGLISLTLVPCLIRSKEK